MADRALRAVTDADTAQAMGATDAIEALRTEILGLLAYTDPVVRPAPDLVVKPYDVAPPGENGYVTIDATPRREWYPSKGWTITAVDVEEEDPACVYFETPDAIRRDVIPVRVQNARAIAAAVLAACDHVDQRLGKAVPRG